MLINLIIIYFACGSPIGVYRITRTAHLRSPRQAAAVGAYFILWPIFAPAILRRSLLVQELNIERAIASLCRAMEKIVFAGNPTISVFEFRDVFARYTGLTMAINRETANSPNDLFKIAKHKNPALASTCLNRRNRKRLLCHQTQARKEFFDLISDLSLSRENGKEFAKLSLQLARLLHDI